MPTTPTTTTRCFDFVVCTPRPGRVRDRPWASTSTSRRGLEAPRRPTWSPVPAMAPRCGRARRGPRRPSRRRTRAAPILSRTARAPSTLGEAGLLDDRRVHDALAPHRRARRALPRGPGVPDVLYVDDGQIVTSAGTAAGLDAAAAPDAPAVRRRRRQRRGPADGGAAAPRRRPGAVHRPGRAGLRRRDPRPAAGVDRRPPAARTSSVETLARRSPHVAAHLRPPVPRRDRHDPARLGDQPAGAGRRGAARAHRPLGRLDRRGGRLRQRRRRCATTSRGCAGSARSSTGVASPAEVSRPRSGSRSGAAPAARRRGRRAAPSPRAATSRATSRWRPPGRACPLRSALHVPHVHLPGAHRGPGDLRPPGGRRATCRTQARRTGGPCRARGRRVGQVHVESARGPGRRGGSPRCAPWRRPGSGSRRPWPAGRVMAPTTSLFIAPTCTSHWFSAGPAACSGTASASATLAHRCIGVGPGVGSAVVGRRRRAGPPGRPGRPAGAGSSVTAETVTQIRPSSTTPTRAPSPKACASGRSGNPVQAACPASGRRRLVGRSRLPLLLAHGRTPISERARSRRRLAPPCAADQRVQDSPKLGKSGRSSIMLR